MNKQDSAANYLETSGSAMFVYALKVAADSGWIASSYLAVAQKGWNGLKAHSISTYSGDSKPEIDHYAPAMSVQNNYTQYVSGANVAVNTPSSVNPHGYAAILMAASVMEFPLSMASLPVKFSSFTAVATANGVTLKWANPDPDGEVKYYIMQRSTDGTGFADAGQLKADGSAVYHWVDNAATGNTLYYRVGAADADGAVYYSTVQTVKFKNGLPAMLVSPNPVDNRRVTLHFSALHAGHYKLFFINSAGKTMASLPVPVSDGEEVLELTLPPAVQKGVYYVDLDLGSHHLIQNIVVN